MYQVVEFEQMQPMQTCKQLRPITMHVKPYGPIVYKSKDEYEAEVAEALHAARTQNPMKLIETPVDTQETSENDSFFF